MILLAMVLSGIAGFQMPNCEMDKQVEIGYWTRELVESNGELATSVEVVSKLTSELWGGACRSSEPRLEPALERYLSKLVSPLPASGTYLALAKVLAQLRVRSRSPEDAVLLLMSDSRKAASLEPNDGGLSYAALSHVPRLGYQLLLDRGHAEALREALASEDRNVLLQVFSGMWFSGGEGRSKGGTKLKDLIVALYDSDDARIQAGAVRSTRWVVNSTEEHRKMLKAFLSRGGRSEQARSSARRELQLGWK